MKGAFLRGVAGDPSEDAEESLLPEESELRGPDRSEVEFLSRRKGEEVSRRKPPFDLLGSRAVMRWSCPRGEESIQGEV